jgi:hypothetical protein
MKISAIVGIDKRTNTILFSDGIEESNVFVQPIIPRSVFTVAEVQDFKDDILPFSSREWLNNPESDNVNLGEEVSFSLTCDLENLKIEILEFDLTIYDFVSVTDYNKTDEISVLIAYDNQTNELLFAEGTDPDGYRYHQLTLDYDIDDNHKVREVLGKELEANVILGVYSNITIEMKRYSIAK